MNMTPETTQEKQAHTPGPWHKGTTRGIFAGELILASAHTMAWMKNPEGESEANAQLIASAPELLSALLLVAQGINTGAIRNIQIMDRSNPDAEEWPVRSLAEIVNAALQKSRL